MSLVEWIAVIWVAGIPVVLVWIGATIPRDREACVWTAWVVALFWPVGLVGFGLLCVAIFPIAFGKALGESLRKNRLR